MKEIQYKTFSLRTHKKNWGLQRINVCQFELTFGCGLHCSHCYTDCYNKLSYLNKELNTAQIKLIIDKVHRSGAIWLCFTGGDPLTRGDFLNIYSYAKDKGFIITVFTNGYSMNKEIARYFKRRPPFVIELTLNAVTESPYEKISGVRGSFKQAMQGINLILKSRLPLKIKTQLTRDNFKELSKIKRFIKEIGLKFRISYDLFARLNGDLTPCSLRISPEDVLSLNGNNYIFDDDCRLSLDSSYRKHNHALFRCAIGGGDGIHIDPYGNMFLCNLIRKPVLNLLKVNINEALNRLLPSVRPRKFVTDSRCNGCGLKELCRICPGKAYVETGNMEAPLKYYCRLARLLHNRKLMTIG